MGRFNSRLARVGVTKPSFLFCAENTGWVFPHRFCVQYRTDVIDERSKVGP
jgi:hypothetical protein